MGGAFYALFMGLFTGYFSIAVGALYVLVGIECFISAAFNVRVLSFLYLALLGTANFIAFVINIIGIAQTDLVATKRGLGGDKIIEDLVPWDTESISAAVYFAMGLGFMILFCVPCTVLAVVNACAGNKKSVHNDTELTAKLNQITVDGPATLNQQHVATVEVPEVHGSPSDHNIESASATKLPAETFISAAVEPGRVPSPAAAEITPQHPHINNRTRHHSKHRHRSEHIHLTNNSQQPPSPATLQLHAMLTETSTSSGSL
ncbi:hypothetical protein Pelo_8664 [Pelomyxa schiedti]|nr:hypothetical protein Pelo_8664 [Pelomyxa schiedti]